MKEAQIIELIFKEVDGDLSAAEKETLHYWLASDPTHVTKAERLREQYKSSTLEEPFLTIDVHQAYQKTLVRVKQTKGSRSILPIIWLSAAAVVVLGGLALFFWSETNTSTNLTGPVVAVELSDGSICWLSDEGSGSFSASGSQRLFSLQGSGYFEVLHNAAEPFVVRTSYGDVTVLGTKFSVNTTEEIPLRVIVQEGRVQINLAASDTSTILEAGEELVLELDQKIEKSELTRPAGDWRLSPKDFSGVRFDSLLMEIERAYHVSFDLTSTSLASCEITFTLSYPTLAILLQSIETLVQGDISRVGKQQYLITGGGCE